jgi:tetratricopeptide (TPR) repeat protein
MTENEEQLSAQFDNAMKLRDEGNLSAARAALETLIKQLLPSDVKLLAHSHMQLGNICDRLREHTQREAHFRAAVEVAPTLQLASLGLFHTLYEQDRIDEALEEMLRLLRLRYSDLYAELLGEGYGSRFSIEQRNRVMEARRLLKRHRQN